MHRVSCISRTFLYLAIILGSLQFQIVQAVPAPFEWGTFNASGSTAYGVYGMDDLTILESGDLAQFIWAGPDGLIDPPQIDGLPGGDDQLLDTNAVVNGSPFPSALQNNGYIPLKTYTFDTDGALDGRTVYIRAWDAATVAMASAYGESETATMSSGGSLNAARWYTPNFVTCQALTLTHNGQGSDPIAAPTNSPGCPPGEYGAAESINLSGAAAAPGWQIAGWSGTEDDASTSSTNTVIMPSNAHTVTVNYELLPPAAPIPLAPAGSIFTTSVTYSWSSVFFAVDYQVLVIEDGTGPVHNQWYLAGDVCSGGACSVTPAAPLSLGAHTWYVKARNAVGSAQSPGTWFHVAAETVPAVPNLRQPAGTIADNQPGYRWDHVGGAVEYQLLVVGADSAQYFNTWYQAVDICNSTLCDVPQPSPLPEQGYAWYVRARNPYGSTWSPGKLFNVFSGVRPVAPTLLAPIGIISDTTPVYTWSDGGDAYDFMLLVVDSQRNREIHDWYLAADICNGTVCTVTQTVPLTNDNYIWYLKARNPAGATWAVGKRFTVFTGGPVGVATPIMPAGIISDTTPTYTWGEGSDAVDYQLLLFNSSGSLILNAWYLADDICSAGSCQATPVMVLSEADYSWQVKSRNPLGAVYSSRLYFTVDLGP